jgi:hypothetical protein
VKNPRPPLRGDLLVEDLVAAYPELIGPLANRGVVCLVCGEPYWGTLEELAAAKGITDIAGLLRDLTIDLAQGPI